MSSEMLLGIVFRLRTIWRCLYKRIVHSRALRRVKLPLCFPRATPGMLKNLDRQHYHLELPQPLIKNWFRLVDNMFVLIDMHQTHTDRHTHTHTQTHTDTPTDTHTYRHTHTHTHPQTHTHTHS
jgi:hypothetical protein